jgi:DNA repair protein RadC
MRLERLGEFKVQSLRETPPEFWTFDGSSPDQIAKYFREFIKVDPRFNPDVECFYTVLLSTRRRVIGYTLISTGTLDTILVHPREVFKPAIVASAAAMVLIHNHPSGDPSPSEADIKVTRDLIRAGQLLKIDVLDHLVMGCPTAERPKDFCSLRELGYFYS